MEKERTQVIIPKKFCEIEQITYAGDLEIRGIVYVGDYHRNFQMGPVTCGGMLVAGTLNAGDVLVAEDFLAQTANLEELNCGGDVEAEYLSCELGAYVLGDITVNTMVSETHHVFCGGKFTGNFMGNSKLLHEHFNDWSNLARYMV